jgi:hypothetical protein
MRGCRLMAPQIDEVSTKSLTGKLVTLSVAGSGQPIDIKLALPPAAAVLVETEHSSSRRVS